MPSDHEQPEAKEPLVASAREPAGDAAMPVGDGSADAGASPAGAGAGSSTSAAGADAGAGSPGAGLGVSGAAAVSAAAPAGPAGGPPAEPPAEMGAPAETNIGAGLWKGIGMWAWILFRISGLILVAYLFVHIAIVSQAQVSSAGMLDRFLETFDQPIMVFLDFMLVTAVLYHGLNGVRILLMDLGVGIKQHKIVFWSVMVVVAGLMAWFAVVAAPYIF